MSFGGEEKIGWKVTTQPQYVAKPTYVYAPYTIYQPAMSYPQAAYGQPRGSFGSQQYIPVVSASSSSSSTTTPQAKPASTAAKTESTSSSKSKKKEESPPYFALDCECVATGSRHNERSVGQISLIDNFERVVLNIYVKPQEKVFSYLTKLSGLTEELISKGIELEKAKELLKANLPKNAILVGQNILQDVQWLDLKEGSDFGGMMDLSGIWRVYNEKYKGYSYFSLQHEAKALLNFTQATTHNAATDAIISMRLYNLYVSIKDDTEQMKQAHRLLLETPMDPSFAKQNPTHDGVCMGQKKTCKCGAPFFF